MMKITEIQELIKFVSKSNVSEVELEMKDFKIIIKTGKAGQTAQPVLIQGPAAAVPQVITPVAIAQPEVVKHDAEGTKTETSKATNGGDENKNYHVVKSPMIGTFYRSPGPDKPPFINVGDNIDAGQAVCIIEAMKLFNEIECDVKGKIVKVLVENATPVEYDQPLFLVDTNA